MASSMSKPGGMSMRAPQQRGPRLVMGGTLAATAAAAAISASALSHHDARTRACERDACRTSLCSSSMCLSAPKPHAGRRHMDAANCIMYGEVSLTEQERRMLDCKWVRLRTSMRG